MREFVEGRIAHYREQRDKALALVADIESGRCRFFSATGNEPMQDVTDERLADQRRIADMMEGLIKAYEARNA